MVFIRMPKYVDLPPPPYHPDNPTITLALYYGQEFVLFPVPKYIGGENEVGPSVRDEEEDAYVDSDYNPDDDVSDHDRGEVNVGGDNVYHGVDLGGEDRGEIHESSDSSSEDDMVYSGDDVDLHKLSEEDEEGPEFPIEDVINEINCDVSKDQAYRAKRKALMIEGDPDVQYTKLWDYCEELRKTNPGSTVILGTEEQGGEHGLNIVRQNEYTFMSDKQKGLIMAFQEVLPGCDHRFCVRHLLNNFISGGFRGLAFINALWRSAYATTVGEYKVRMQQLTDLDPAAIEWFKDKSPLQWSKSHFSEYSKCDMLLNNVCESFNGTILQARDKPIITMLEWIRQYLTKRLQKNRDKAEEKWKGKIYLIAMSCTYRKWGLSGIPCAHALSAIFDQKQDPEDYVHSYYSIATYKRVYEPAIMGINGHNAGTCDLDDEESSQRANKTRRVRKKKNALNNQPRTSNDRGGDNEVHVDSGINDNEVVPPMVETPTQEQDGGCSNDIGEVSRRVGNETEMQPMTFNNDIEQGSKRSAFRPPRSIKPPSNLQSAIGIPAKQPIAQDASQQPVMLPPLSTTEETEAEDQVETIIETQVRTEVGVYPPPLPTMVGPIMYQQLQSSVPSLQRASRVQISLPSLQRASRVQIRASPLMVGCEFFPTRINSTQASSSSSVPVVVDQGQKYVAISDLGPEMSQPSVQEVQIRAVCGTRHSHSTKPPTLELELIKN
ncbi:hypothetical protein BUALT_Bualt09G0113800 [Buddleja alternifolia]|uniref:Zinc finger PMZ-type domain-containing protein n=1 Tax=Buddleja alternifolia TaxID=168488 RepID=A0AAV6XCE5_9LAMI|nr:hypothetical protein BUALT_Bualt09G0113800 [Buddleja alternifolia]